MRRDTPSSREKRAQLAADAGARAAEAGLLGDTGGCAGVGCGAFRWHQGAGAGSVGFDPDRSPTLDTVKPPAVVYAVRMREGKPGGGKGPLVQEDVSGTLATRNDQTVVCLGDAAANASVDVDMCGSLKENNDRNQPIVAVAGNQRGEVRLDGGDGGTTGALPATRSGKQFQAVTDGSVVRRLTPLECERLQGMPDGWTMVPYRGRTAEECPDGPRYKAIGNSMAVPVMRWIGERIGNWERSSCAG